MQLLEVKNVSHTYLTGFWLKPFEVLKDLSFSVPENKVFGFLGPNGAGKTSLIKLIVGLSPPKQGLITIGSHDAITLEAKMKVGYLPERPYFHDHLTGEDLLYYMGKLSGLTRKTITSRIGSVLSKVSMSHARHKELKTYSKGMLQRIGIAQAILHDPELLIFDEPMSGLDPIGRKEVRELMVDLARSGKTVFFSTHIIQDVEMICDEVAIIQKGKLIASGAIEELLKDQKSPVEVVFRNLTGEGAQKVSKSYGSIEKMQDAFRISLKTDADLSPFLKKVLDEGGEIVSATNMRPGIEEFFK